MSKQEAVHLSPYVASGIIEHVKRRRRAAGFLLGHYTDNSMYIVDFLPLTHTDALPVVSDMYVAENRNRLRIKRIFCQDRVLGWYSAGNAYSTEVKGSTENAEDIFKSWCLAPGYRFAFKAGHVSLHLHCETPTPNDQKPQIVWSAEQVRLEIDRSEDKSETTKTFTCKKEKTMLVIVHGDKNDASNAVMHHIHKSLTDDKAERINVLNLDEFSYEANTLDKPMKEKLIETQTSMKSAINKAKQLAASSSSSSATDRANAEAVENQLKRIEKIKNELEQQQQNPAAREDFISQRLKDALMTKAVAVLLKKQIGQIVDLASDYTDHSSGQHRHQQQRRN